MYICVDVCAPKPWYICECQNTLRGIIIPFPIGMFWGWNSDHEAWKQESLPTESSYDSSNYPQSCLLERLYSMENIYGNKEIEGLLSFMHSAKFSLSKISLKHRR